MGTVKPVALSILAATLIVLLSWQAFFDQINLVAYDFVMRLAGPVEPSSEVLIVAIDEESLDQVGSWPWPRGILAEVLVEVLAGEPAAVGVDILLDDETGSADQELAAVLDDSVGVVLATRLDETDSGTSWRLPIELFVDSPARLGHVHADADLDAVLRRIVTAKHAEGLLVSAFAVEVLDAASRLPPRLREDLGGAVRIAPEELRIRFVGDRGSFETVSAGLLLEGRVDPALFEGRIVLIGATAAGLNDDWMTPMSTAGLEMSGIEVHANAIDTILSGRDIRPVGDLAVLVLLVALILGLRAVERRFEGARFYAAGVAAVPLTIALSWIAMATANRWLPFPTLLAGVVLVVPALGIRKFVKVSRDLDEKLDRMSTWTELRRTELVGESLREQVRGLADGASRDRWLAVLESYDLRLAEHEAERAAASAELTDVPRKLNAVEFLNREMARRVSFNDAVLGAIDDAIIVSDPAGNVVYQNPAARHLAGYEEEPPSVWVYVDRMVRVDFDQGEASPYPGMMDVFAATFIGDQPIVLGATEHVQRPGASSHREFTLSIAGIGEVAILAILRDVTAERELDRTKNDMVALVSHELRTPLTSIRGFADMLETYGLVEEKGKRFVRSILAESERLDTLIQAFLDVAAIEAGRQPMDVVDVDPAGLVAELSENHRSLGAGKDIVISADESGAGDRTFRGDRTLIYQALANLVSNAIKYSPRGTTVEVSSVASPDGVEFRVTDQGHGIPASETERIFEKFYRRSDKETRNERGFGLGLAFVRQVARLHQAVVTIESEVGKGSSFSFRVPWSGPSEDAGLGE